MCSSRAPEAAPAELSGHAAADALKQADSIATVAAAVPIAAAAAAAEQAAARRSRPNPAGRRAPQTRPHQIALPKWPNRWPACLAAAKSTKILYEELETVLITSDMGIEATDYLMKDVRNA